MTDLSNFRLKDIKEAESIPMKIINTTWLWLINRPPGSTFDVLSLPESKREAFIKVACLFIIENPYFTFNENFTLLKRDRYDYNNNVLMKKQIKESITMNNYQIIETPDSTQFVKIGTVNNGYLNLMTSFNPFDPNMLELLKPVKSIKVMGIYRYEDNTGGISLQISEDFRYPKFIDDITDIFMSITFETN